jgi:hypothetical protein
MSYVFDVLERVYAGLIEPSCPFDRVAARFRLLLSEIHEANHRLDDAINKDPQVKKLARLLEEEVRGLDRGP